MKKFSKKYGLGLLIIVIFCICIPIFTNYIISLKTPWDIPVAGFPSDWIDFYGSFVGTVGSFLVALCVILYEQKEKLDEKKRNVIQACVTFNNCIYLDVQSISDALRSLIDIGNNIHIKAEDKKIILNEYSSNLSSSFQLLLEHVSSIITQLQFVFDYFGGTDEIHIHIGDVLRSTRKITNTARTLHHVIITKIYEEISNNPVLDHEQLNVINQELESFRKDGHVLMVLNTEFSNKLLAKIDRLTYKNRTIIG